MDKFFNQIKNTISKLKTNKILILGKGPSIDDYYSYNLKNYFIINLNDSYKISEGNLILINKPWALNDLSNLKKKPIIVSSIYEKNLNLKNFYQFKIFENIEINSLSNKYTNKPLLLFAIEFFFHLSKITNIRYEINLLGFDFNFKNIHTYTSNFLDDIDFNSGYKKKYILNEQKKLLLKIISNKKIKSRLNIKHIGNLKESYCKNIDFINQNSQNIYKDKNKHPKVLIVAEVTTNHFGDFKMLLKMTKLIKDSGADYVKIQKRDPETFYTKDQLNKYYYSKFGNSFREYREGLELSYDQLVKFDNYCKKIKLKWFSTVLDIKSFDLINKFKPDLIKIPSTISSYKTFHDKIAKKYSGAIVISTGLTSKNYEKYIINKFKKNKKIYLLQCTSSYPTRDQDCNIGIISHYSKLSEKNKNIIPGFSSHDLGFTASIMSVAAGARMIEKHVYYQTKTWAHFDKVAVNLKNGDLKKFVNSIRKAEEIYGNEKKVKLKSEFHKYNKK